MFSFRPIFGDIGSGYWIGTEVLRAVGRAKDGIGSPTILEKYLEERVGNDLLTWTYQGNGGSSGTSIDTTWKRFADLSPLAFKAYEDKDPGNFFCSFLFRYI